VNTSSNITKGGPVLGLPTLRGSSRQVAWAEQIREQAIRTALDTLCRVPAANIVSACEAIEALVGFEEASAWIDARYMNFHANSLAGGAQ
jgi:hypothetical protein